jgi:hypothetical protein
MTGVQLIGPPHKALKAGLLAIAALSIIFGTIAAAGSAVHAPHLIVQDR